MKRDGTIRIAFRCNEQDTAWLFAALNATTLAWQQAPLARADVVACCMHEGAAVDEPPRDRTPRLLVARPEQVDHQRMVDALSDGPCAIIARDCAPSDLATAIGELRAGKPYVPAALLRLAQLTPLHVFDCIARWAT